jgi:hypothetical protein
MGMFFGTGFVNLGSYIIPENVKNFKLWNFMDGLVRFFLDMSSCVF